MAIKLLQGTPHGFMHDLESFFWVLFWICMHFGRKGKRVKANSELARWCTDPAAVVAKSKLGAIADPETFEATMKADCTPFYKPLLPVMLLFRQALFPSGRPQKLPSLQLYDNIKQLLREEATKLDQV